MAKKSIWDILGNAAGKVYDRVDQALPSSVLPSRQTIQQQAPAIGKAIVRYPAQAVNTVRAGAQGAYDLGRVGVADLTNNPLARRNAITTADQNLTRNLAPNSGITGQGTFFKDRNEAQNIGTKDLAKKIVGKGIEGASYATPARLSTLPRTVAANAAGGVAGSAGGQYADKGKVDVREAALAGVLPAALPVAGVAGRKVVKDFQTMDQAGKVKVGPTPKVSTTPVKGGGQIDPTLPTPTPVKVAKERREIINTARYAIDDDAKKNIIKTAEDNLPAIKEQTGAPLTIKEVVQNAKIKTAPYKSGKSREQTLESVTKLKNTRDRVAQLQQKSVAAGGLTADEQSELIKHTVTVATRQADIARQLGSLRASASPEEKTLLNKALEQLAKQGHDVDDLMNAAKDFNLNDPKQLVEFYRKFEKATKEDWFDKLRYSSMLSSPITHIRNVAANTVGGTVVAPATKAVAGSLDAARSLVTGGERQRFAGEAGSYIKGYGSSFGDAAKQFGDIMSGRQIVENPDINLSATLPLATKGPAMVADQILGVIGKLMEATDAAGAALAKGGEKAALKYREGKGVRVKNLESTAHDNAQYQLFRGDLGGKEQGNLLNAIDFIPNKILEARKSDNPVLRVTAKLAAPFVKTPTNISKQMLEYSPLGVLTLPGHVDKTNQIAKSVLGTMAVGVTGAALAAEDRLSFSAPTDPDERLQFQTDGKQPYSIKVGDNWISYQYLHPAISFQLAAVASVNKAMNEGKIDEPKAQKLLNGYKNVMSFFVDQSYFKNGQDFINNIQSKSENLGATASSAAAATAANTVSQFIPFRALMTWIDNMTDQTQRKVDTKASFLEQFGQNISRQIPELSEKLKAKTDALGNPIMKPHPVLNSFSPAKVSTDTGGPLKDISAPQGGDATKQKLYRDNGFNTPEGRRFLEMSSTERREAALKDPTMRDLYDKNQTLETHSRSDLVLPKGLESESVKTLNRFNKLTTTEKEQLYASDPAAEYQYNKAAFERDKLEGKFTKAELAVKQKSLKKQEVGSKYNQDTRDLYGMTQNDLANYLTENPDDKQINDLLAYDKALVDSGVIERSKFAKWMPGQARISTSGGGRSSSTTGKAKTISTPSGKVSAGKAAPAPSIKTSAGKKVAIKKRQRNRTVATKGGSGSNTLKITRG